MTFATWPTVSLSRPLRRPRRSAGKGSRRAVASGSCQHCFRSCCRAWLRGQLHEGMRARRDSNPQPTGCPIGVRGRHWMRPPRCDNGRRSSTRTPCYIHRYTRGLVQWRRRPRLDVGRPWATRVLPDRSPSSLAGWVSAAAWGGALGERSRCETQRHLMKQSVAISDLPSTI
jgi:hypothetical protein